MKKSIQLYISVVVAIFSIVACGGESQKPKEKEEFVQADSVELSREAEFALINEELKKDHNNARLYIKRAQLHNKYREIGFAIEDVDRALKIDSLIPEFYLLKAELCKKGEDFKYAKETLDKCLEIDNDNVEARIELGWLAFIIKNYEQAIDYADAALKRDVYAAEAYYLKGMIFNEQLDTAKAISSFVTAVEQESNYYEAYIQLGLLHINEDNNLSEGYYKNALDLKPKSIEGLYGLGMWSQGHDKYNQAIDCYNKIIDLAPFRDPYFNLGYIHQEYLKVYDVAIDYYDAAINEDPEYFQAFYNKGLCYEFLGKYKLAEENLRQALKIYPEYDYAAIALERVLKSN